MNYDWNGRPICDRCRRVADDNDGPLDWMLTEEQEPCCAGCRTEAEHEREKAAAVVLEDWLRDPMFLAGLRWQVREIEPAFSKGGV